MRIFAAMTFGKYLISVCEDGNFEIAEKTKEGSIDRGRIERKDMETLIDCLLDSFEEEENGQ